MYHKLLILKRENGLTEEVKDAIDEALIENKITDIQFAILLELL